MVVKAVSKDEQGRRESLQRAAGISLAGRFGLEAYGHVQKPGYLVKGTP